MNFTAEPFFMRLKDPLRLAQAPLLCALLLHPILHAQQDQTPAVHTLSIDASTPATSPEAAGFTPGTAISPTHHVLGLNQRYLTLDDHPWLPVMGEFHFSRTPESDWEQEILKMKASGVQIIATYLFWIHHEEVEGQWNWSGRRDLRRFVALCQKHGLFVYVRIGPWAHGEVRNGGLPDWLLAEGPTRRNAPGYLRHVDEFYAQIATQLRGQLWKDGGPVIGVQLENEYGQRGPGAGEEHILTLKKLAIANGLDVPFYSVTGWDRAVVPQGAVLPVYGGYPDAPWDASMTPLPPNEVYLFRFANRVAGNMGVIGTQAESTDAKPAPATTPFITAEMGGGIQDTYHRRPVLTADDVAAMFPVMLGSGVNLYGTYMYHGGINPQDGRTTLQESQATGYPSDLPIASYDFQAPISSYGEQRPLLRKLKLVNYFLNEFGPQLAPMTPHAPQTIPTTPADLSTPRAAVRSTGDQGFVFLNNHVRGVTMPPRNNFQMQIKLPGGTLSLPSTPLTIPSDAYFIWPFHMNLNGASLHYSTAQLFTRLQVNGAPAFVFFCIPGVRCEISIQPAAGLSMDAGNLMIKRSADEWLVGNITGGTDRWITLSNAGHILARLLVLSQDQAENTWIANFNHEPHLLLTSASFFANDHQITLQSMDNPNFHVQVIPGLSRTPTATRPLHPSKTSSLLNQFDASVAAVTPGLTVEQIKQAEEVPPATLGRAPRGKSTGLAQSPEETGMAAAAEWRITLAPPRQSAGVSKLFLRIHYTGDLAQLKQADRLLDDNFFNGQPWNIGLPHTAPSSPHSSPAIVFTLQVLPLNAQSAVFLEPSLRNALPPTGQILHLDSVVAIPQYQLEIQTGSSAKPRP